MIAWEKVYKGDKKYFFEKNGENNFQTVEAVEEFSRFKKGAKPFFQTKLSQNTAKVPGNFDQPLRYPSGNYFSMFTTRFSKGTPVTFS